LEPVPNGAVYRRESIRFIVIYRPTRIMLCGEIMKRSDAIKKYGKSKWKAMNETGELDAITVRKLPDGDIDIPLCNLESAERAIKQDA
jgi:hypothetical protein